ncbi:MAG: DUF2167 domain-containing protein [Gammaproteobacteria bacterium]
MMSSNIQRFAAIVLALTISQVVAAQVPADPAQNEMDPVWESAVNAKIDGPKAIPLGDQAVLNLPANFAFVPLPEAAALMDAMGNQTDDGFYGLVFGAQIEGFVSISFENAGYVKDDDAKDWDADELLQDLQDGTEAGNEDRRRRGIPEFVVSGWIEKPAYDSMTHRLVWSAELRDKITPRAGEHEPGANYNTYQLGREGFITMNLVTDLANVNAQKPIAKQLLAGLEFNSGKRYSDFDVSSDKVAEYGLAALVGGIAAKKLGLLAMIGVFFAKFAKVFVVAAVGLAAGLGKLFGRKKHA